MIKGISVAYIHTPNKKLADWYQDKLGLQKGYGDDTWQAFETIKYFQERADFKEKQSIGPSMSRLGTP